MDGWLDALPWLTGGLVLAAALVVLRRPVEWLLGAALRTGVGLAVLYALSGVGGLAGVHMGVNLVNALVLGLLGAPGFGLLLMVHWVLGL